MKKLIIASAALLAASGIALAEQDPSLFDHGVAVGQSAAAVDYTPTASIEGSVDIDHGADANGGVAKRDLFTSR